MVQATTVCLGPAHLGPSASGDLGLKQVLTPDPAPCLHPIPSLQPKVTKVYKRQMMHR